MIRIDDERDEGGRSSLSSSILSFLENTILGRDARRPAGPSVHLFSSERGPALIRAASANREIDAGTLKNNVPALIVCRRRANERADAWRQW